MDWNGRRYLPPILIALTLGVGVVIGSVISHGVGAAKASGGGRIPRTRDFCPLLRPPSYPLRLRRWPRPLSRQWSTSRLNPRFILAGGAPTAVITASWAIFSTAFSSLSLRRVCRPT